MVLREEGRGFPKKLPPLPSLGDECETKTVRAALEVLDHTLSIPHLVGGDARISVGHAEAEGLVEQHGQFARRRRDRLGLADARSKPSIERAERCLCPSDIDRGDARQTPVIVPSSTPRIISSPRRPVRFASYQRPPADWVNRSVPAACRASSNSSR